MPSLRTGWLTAALCLLACGPTEGPPDAGPCDPSTPELCNFEDDDCDGDVDEDFLEYGLPCDGTDTDVCNEGLYSCAANGEGLACSDATGDSVELCNDLDDDCDGFVDEDFDLGIACDSEEDDDLCADDTTVCNSTGNRVICQSLAPEAVERCNGDDDDCDGAIDEDFNAGGSCDSEADTDQCPEGILVCNASGSGANCEEAAENDVELCNGVDDDCDGPIDEGYANLGLPCDSDEDTNACLGGKWVCNGAGTGVVCNDTGDTTIEKCNGVDDDCDGVIDNGYNIDTPCDGPDTDACTEGTIQCISDNETACTDDELGDDNVESCNGEDDDCDGLTDEGGVCCNNFFCDDGPDTDANETCGNCPNDCHTCGDGCCQFEETATQCPQDCS